MQKGNASPSRSITHLDILGSEAESMSNGMLEDGERAFNLAMSRLPLSARVGDEDEAESMIGLDSKEKALYLSEDEVWDLSGEEGDPSASMPRFGTSSLTLSLSAISENGGDEAESMMGKEEGDLSASMSRFGKSSLTLSLSSTSENGGDEGESVIGLMSNRAVLDSLKDREDDQAMIDVQPEEPLGGENEDGPMDVVLDSLDGEKGDLKLLQPNSVEDEDDPMVGIESQDPLSSVEDGGEESGDEGSVEEGEKLGDEGSVEDGGE